jgi:hypothetical protein
MTTTTNPTLMCHCPPGAVFGDVWEYGERVVVAPLVILGVTSRLGNS